MLEIDSLISIIMELYTEKYDPKVTFYVFVMILVGSIIPNK